MSGGSIVIPVELFLFGALGMAAPYLGRPLGLVVDVRPVTEVVDHVIPGAAVVAVALAAIVTGRRWFVACMVVVAAGLWMTASHLPLLLQAGNGQADLGAAVFHAAPGMVILVLGSVASVVDARAEHDEDEALR
ncbi:MAG: hypothetical protein M3019_03830 [Candidatus Dormibacteraeota bacterium]|nr:hypothetical protein [Candidatus Dormibacteraeota bacterium]